MITLKNISYPAISSFVNPDSSRCMNRVVWGKDCGSIVPNPFEDLLVVEIRDLVDKDRFDGDDIKEDSNGSRSSSRQTI